MAGPTYVATCVTFCRLLSSSVGYRLMMARGSAATSVCEREEKSWDEKGYSSSITHLPPSVPEENLEGDAAGRRAVDKCRSSLLHVGHRHQL